MVTKITKEAVQKVHEQIFGNAFCVLGETRAECTPPGFPSLRTRLPFPEFTVKHCPPYTIIFNREHCTSQLGFLFEIDQTSVRQRVVVKFNSADFSLGVIPGDVVLSINDVDIQQQSVHDMNSKLSPNGPPEVKLVVVPSEESIEWSVRAIDIDPSCLFELQRLFSVSGDCTNRCYFDSLLKKQDGLLRRLNLRHWIKETGSFNLLNEIIRQVYLHVLRDSTSEHKSLCNVNDLVIVSHRDGYSLGSITEKFPDGTYQIHLSPGRQQLRVSLDDISRANAKKLEGIEDLMLMQHLNEPALVYNLHARFLTSLPYTYAGDFALIAFNPMRNLDIYDEFVKELFVKCENRLDMPPHIYSVAQTALANLKRAFIARRDFGAADECFEASGDERTCSITTDGVSAASTAPVKVPTQAICVLGRSGSGKSINTEHLVEYFFPQSAPGSEIDASKVRAVMCLLDAFTCSRTLLNSNASRCLRLFTIELIAEIHSDSSVQLNPSSLLIDLLLLDKFRVTRRPMGEPTFHIFYYFLAGLEDKARREYMLEDLSFPNLFMTPLQKPEDQSLAKSRWQAVTQAARVLGTGFEEVFNSCVCRLLAAIYHLGCAGATAPQAQTSTTRRFINLTAAERAAHLLGSASVDALTADVFGNEESPRTPSVSSGQSIQAMDSLASESASNLDLLGGFVANLYAIATTTLRDNINKALNSSSSVMRSASDINSPSRSARIFVVDPPGLQTPEDGGRVSGG
uniref:Myosin motor domain-containing protein n=1 Tax=Mesocestoides corti TaxID=53468 RepID=A0A5K3EX37_MESCO